MASITHFLIRIAATLTIGALACSCKTSLGHDSTASNPAPVVFAAPPHDAASRKNDVTPLNQLLLRLAARTTPWNTFDHVPGVQWRDATPQANPDASAPDLAYDRSGTLMLNGFGMVDVPDGRQGAEAGTKQDNEGRAGVTLSGDAESVQSVTVLKFYPSKNYQDILQKQFDSSVVIRLVADACALDYGTTSANTQENIFYQIAVGSSSTPIYVEAFIDDDAESHGPGSTTFVFYRSKPAPRISAMHCRKH